MAMMYESLWNMTQKMLEAAESSKWDELLELEAKRSGMVNRMRSGMAESEIEELRARKDLVQKILVADTRISQLAVSWMDEIQSLMRNIRSEKRVIHAYSLPVQRF